MPNLSQSCLTQLTQNDFNFLSQVLVQINRSPDHESAFFELVSDPETLDSLLTHPKMLTALFDIGQTIDVSAELYFYALVRHSFKEAGLDHADLADYVAATLVDYAKGNPFQSTPDDSIQISEMPYHIDYVRALNAASSYDSFYLHARCGNQFLVLTGLYPHFIRNRKNRRGAPGVRYYEKVACQSYRSAGGNPLANQFRLGEVFQLLADDFRRTRRALNQLTREYLF